MHKWGFRLHGHVNLIDKYGKFEERKLGVPRHVRAETSLWLASGTLFYNNYEKYEQFNGRI